MIDDRIKLLAKRIHEEAPPPVLMKYWINDLVQEMIKDVETDPNRIVFYVTGFEHGIISTRCDTVD